MRFSSILLFILIVKLSPAQDSTLNNLSLQIGLSQLDFFTGIRYGKTIHHIEPFIIGEIGINRTIFQSRFFPRFTGGVVYYFLEQKKIKLGAKMSYGYSVLKVNKNTDHFNQWNEIYIGTHFEIGSKVRFTNELNTGLLNERYFSQMSKQIEGVNSLGFYVNVGVCYAW